jgi:DEAD/DEAH box helicase domain-containing protein
MQILQKLKDVEIDGASAIHAAEHGLLNQFALSQDLKADCRAVKEEYQEGVTAKRLPR